MERNREESEREGGRGQGEPGSKKRTRGGRSGQGGKELDRGAKAKRRAGLGWSAVRNHS